jgi:2-oxoglutarate dehydrogenase N-terminus
VSSESPRATADLSKSEHEQTGAAAQAAGRPGEPLRTSQPGTSPQEAGPPAARNGSPPPASPQGPDPHVNASDFGANQWLVDELYQRYLADPGSVDQAWWSFFADYRPSGGPGDDQRPWAAGQGGAPAATGAKSAPQVNGAGAAGTGTVPAAAPETLAPRTVPP